MDAFYQFQGEILQLIVFCLLVGGLFGYFIRVAHEVAIKRNQEGDS